MSWILAETWSFMPDAERGILLLLDATIKGTLVLAVALAIMGLLRVTTANQRYRMCAFALLSLVALPMLTGLLPDWRVPLLPTISQAQPAEIEMARPNPAPEPTMAMLPAIGDDLDNEIILGAYTDDQLLSLLALSDLARELDSTTIASEALPEIGAPVVIESPMPNDHVAATDPLPTQSAPASWWPAWSWTTWVFVLWGMGGGLVLAALGLGLSRIRAFTRSALPLDDEKWTTLLAELSGQIGLTRPVCLRHCRQIGTPMTWGHVRPVVLLPTNCLSWSPKRRRVVLMHELVHVHRRDWIMQMISQVICAAYWFNPLVWVAGHRLSIEREKACDDQVLGYGTRPSDYASHLLDIARSLASGGSLTMASIGMAHRSQLEGRLLAILDPRRGRRGFGHIATLAAIVGMGAGIVPLAAISPWAEAEAAPMVAPAAGDDEIRIQTDDEFNFNWSEDGARYRVRIEGEVVLTEDGIESISDDGALKLSERDGDTKISVVITTDDDGDLDYDFKVNGKSRDLDRRAKRWIARMVRETVERFQVFEEEMAELEVNMAQMQVDLEEQMSELHREMANIEIPEIDLSDMRIALQGIEGLPALEQLEHLNIEIPEIDLSDMHIALQGIEGLQALKGLRGLNIEIPEIDLGDLHIALEGIEGIHTLEKLEHLNIEIPEIDLSDLHEQLKGLEGLKGLSFGNGGHAIRIPHIEMGELNAHLKELKKHLGERGNVDIHFGDDDDHEGFRGKIRELVEGRAKALSGLHEADIEKKIHAALKAHQGALEQLREHDFNFGEGMEFHFDGDDFDFGDLGEVIREAVERYKDAGGKFKFDRDFDFDHEGLQERIRDAVERHKGAAGDWRGAHEDFEKHLRPQMEKLRERLQGLDHIEMPDMEALHKQLAPIMKRLPELEGLGERIERQIRPQMDKLRERMKVLEVYISEMREQVDGQIEEIIADEVDSSRLSRGGKKQLANAIEDLAGRLGDRLGVNIEDGVCVLNDSERRIASRVNRSLKDMAGDDLDYDDKILDRIADAAGTIADRLSDMEFEVDSELLDKIENFEVDMENNFGDFDFRFDDEDDNDDDEDDDDWDDWDDVAFSRIAI